MDDLKYFQERMDKQDKKLECLEKKMDQVMEQVTLGKHMVTFAKMIGWGIGVVATVLEFYRRVRG